MSRYTILVNVLLLAIIGTATGCGGAATEVNELTFDQLFANPDKYNGKTIAIEGFCFHGFEIIVLSEMLEYSGYAPGHFVPKGRMVWIEGGIPKEVYDRLYRQTMMGPEERYGKARLEGKFEYGEQFGHLGSFGSQIFPLEVELLPWSPPTPGQ